MIDVLFVNSTESADLRLETNGTMILATKMLHAGFKVNVLRFYEIDNYKQDYHAFIDSAVSKILQINPKCVSFYTLWPYYHIMLRIAAEIKKCRTDIVTVFAGPQASLSATKTMEAMNWVDYICTGEGEDTVVPFFTALLEGNNAIANTIPGVYYRQNGKCFYSGTDAPLADLNKLPYWDDRIYPSTEYADDPDIKSKDYFMPIDVGRGCPFNCTFCCTSKFLSRSHRLKTPERIMEDIFYYNKKYGITSFWFSHDAFTTNKKLVSRLCDYIIDSGISITWECCSRIDLLSEDLILKMKKAGMTSIQLGVESGSARMQQLTNKRLNLDHVDEMINFLLKNKINLALFFMYGFPDETEEDLALTLDFFFSTIDRGVRHASMAFCRFYPGAKITEDYFDQLVYNPDIKKLARGIFGYREEIPMLLENKAIFPFFYHLHTPLRDEYQYVYVLAHMYQQFPNSIRHLRQLYKGDNLRFYKDFYQCNKDLFEKDITEIVRSALDEPMQLLDNMLHNFTMPYIRQLRALLKFDVASRKVRKSEDDISIQQVFDFSFVDYKLKLPIDQYSDGKTEILLEKVEGKMRMKILWIDHP